MTRDQGYWIWPVDSAASRSRLRSWAIGASLCYAAGAVVLLLQAIYALPPVAAETGVALLALGVAGSVAVLGKVLVTRHRLIP